MIDIVVDSSIIIGISRLYMENVKHPRDRREQFLFEIKDAITNCEFTPVITPTIRREIMRGKSFDSWSLKLLDRYCEVLKFDQYSQDKTLLMTDAYGNYLIDDFPAIIDAEHYLEPNYNDATIVSETDVEQKRRGRIIPLLTDNIKDVCDEAKINYVNKRHNMPKVHIHSIYTYKDAIELAKRQCRENFI